MAEGKQTVKGLEGSEPLDNDGAGSVLVASKDAVAQPGDLKHEDAVADATTGDPEAPPLRTARPDVPIIGRLATGAGQHKPTGFLSEDHDTLSGRFIQPEPATKADKK